MRLIALAAAGLALPGLAHAQSSASDGGLSFSGSVTVATAYVSDGLEYSDGLVVQPYLELGYAGFYAGIWATNAEEDLLGASSEVDFYIGYRGEAGSFYYDIGYGYYVYPGASGFNSGEVLVSGGVGLSDALFATVYLAYSPDFETLDRSLGIDYYGPVDGLSLAATLGNNESWRYWSVGASYALSETISASLTWHDTDLVDTDGLLVAGLNISF